MSEAIDLSNVSGKDTPQAKQTQAGKGDILKDAETFFTHLDSELMKSDLEAQTPEEIDAAKQTQQQDKSKNLGTAQQPGKPGPEDAETLKKRYAASSTEAKKLAAERKELEPYMPILEAMKTDPNLISHVRSYFEGGGLTPKSITEQLNLDADFEINMQEAVSDPNSDSAKVLDATVDNLVTQRLNHLRIYTF